MYKLKDGISYRPYGEDSLIDASNITDNIAKLLLKKGVAKESDFEQKKQPTKSKNK